MSVDPSGKTTMRHASSTLPSAHVRPRSAAPGGIEWEELPSLAGRLDPGAFAGSGQTVWDSTRPAELEPAVASGPFREPLDGVAIREVVEPDVFRHFFGR